MAPEDACAADMLALIRWQGRTMAVPLSQLAAVDPDDSTAEAIADWHYWVAQGYCFSFAHANRKLTVYQHLSLSQVEPGYQKAVRGLEI